MGNVFEQGHALVIGVGGEDFEVTAADAEIVASVLRDSTRCAYPATQVRLLLEEEATRDGVVAALRDMKQQVGDKDTLVIYFSGHGITYGPEARHALVPHGYDLDRVADTTVDDELFTELVRAIPARRKLILLDCCFAAGVFHAQIKALPRQMKTALPFNPQRFRQGAGTAVIASSTSTETSLILKGDPFSAFTMAIVEALCGHGATRQNGYVHVTDLALYAREQVVNRTDRQQHPVLELEHADNYAVAYYAAGDNTKLATLPVAFTTAPALVPSASELRFQDMLATQARLRTILIEAYDDLSVLAGDVGLGSEISRLEPRTTAAEKLVRLADGRGRMEKLFASADACHNVHDWEAVKDAYRVYNQMRKKRSPSALSSGTTGRIATGARVTSLYEPLLDKVMTALGRLTPDGLADPQLARKRLHRAETELRAMSAVIERLSAESEDSIWSPTDRTRIADAAEKLRAARDELLQQVAGLREAQNLEAIESACETVRKKAATLTRRLNAVTSLFLG